MAEKLLQAALVTQKEPYSKLVVVSAGLAAWEGDEASRNSVKVLESVGLDLSQHRSQKLTQELVDKAFAIFCMTQSQLLAIEHTFDPIPAHLYLMRSFLPDTAQLEISDPYSLDISAYEACRDSMLEVLPLILDFIKKEYTVT